MTKANKRSISAEKVQILVDAYLNNGFNKKEALIAAGYSKASAQAHVHNVFSNHAVEAEILRRQSKARAKYELTEEWVIQRLMRIANAPEILAKFKVVGEDGQLTWDFTGATEEELSTIEGFSSDHYTEGRGKDSRLVKKFKIDKSDVKGALDSLCRRLGLFDDKMTVGLEGSIIERIQAGRNRITKNNGDTQ